MTEKQPGAVVLELRKIKEERNKDTVERRKKIGFLLNPKEWASQPAIYDEFGHTLRIAGQPVMEDWEEGYMQELADVACSKGGRVLELGYGLGLSARAIQNHSIESHDIIEANKDVIKRGTEDLKEAITNNRAHILPGFWQDITPTLQNESFDGILFDTYPLTQQEIHSNHFSFFTEAYRLLKSGGILTYYSDETTKFSKKHLAKLMEAGFKKENIRFKICEVNPPEDCEYWQDKTILVPIVTK
jgi:guanidinoacetate N-methyltransferase